MLSWTKAGDHLTPRSRPEPNATSPRAAATSKTARKQAIDIVAILLLIATCLLWFSCSSGDQYGTHPAYQIFDPFTKGSDPSPISEVLEILIILTQFHNEARMA